MNDNYIQSGGIKLFVRELGQGGDAALLLVHGGPDWDHSYLLPAARRIAQSRRVVLFDLRGCGRSGRCAEVEDYSREAAAADIVAVARAVGAPVHLLGFSFGGRLAVRAAKMEPDCFRSLILASTTLRGQVDWDDEPVERSRRKRRVPDFKEVLSRDDLDGASQTRQLAVGGLPLDVYDETEIPRIRQIIEEVEFSGEWGKAWRAGLLESGAGGDAEWLHRSVLPTLILHARHDYRFPVEHTAEFDDDAHVRRVVFENAGHLVHLERTAVWADAVVSFVDEIEDTLHGATHLR